MGIFDEFGVRKVVNAYGTVTPYGGVLLAPEVLTAMSEAAQSFVDVGELAARGGRLISHLLGFPDGLVTAGAAAGLSIATAAALCGSDRSLAAALPNVQLTRREVLVHRCQRTHWTQAVRLAGARVVEFGSHGATSPDALRDAITERTAAIVYYAEHAAVRSLPLTEVTRLADASGVHVIVDAAALGFPPEELRRYGDAGAAVTLVSGGKLLGGPASTGVALGTESMIQAMRVHSNPNFALGRPMKVGKEDIAGLVRAVQVTVSRGSEEPCARWRRQAFHIAHALKMPEGVRCRYVDRGEDDVLPRIVPRVYIEWDPESLGATAPEVARLLLNGEPGIAVGAWERRISVNPAVLLEAETDLVVRRVNQVMAELASATSPP